jgi:hypothetical protein
MGETTFALEPQQISIRGCARCGGTHEHLRFKVFTFPIENPDGSVYTHFAICPQFNEPIVMRYVPIPEVPA